MPASVLSICREREYAAKTRVDVGSGMYLWVNFDSNGFTIEPSGARQNGCVVDWPRDESYDRYAILKRIDATSVFVSLYCQDAQSRKVTTSWDFNLCLVEEEEEG